MNPTINQHTVKSILEARHQPSGLNSRFNGGQQLFADYVTHHREMINRARWSTAANIEIIIEGNAPFELFPSGEFATGCNKPYKRGILLTHGLTDSPYFMRYLAAFFQEKGFRVMAVLLPGHGTQPGDLLKLKWKEWDKAVAYGTNKLAEEVDEVFLAGFSAGAALSVYRSAQDDRVNGLFLFAPALKISPKAAWANLHKPYSWLLPASKWVSIQPDRDIYKYESFPKNAAAQMYMLTKKIQQQLQVSKVNIPVFTVASADDATTDISATLSFMRNLQNSLSRLVLYTSNDDLNFHDFPVGMLERLNCALPHQRILSSAHTALMLPPENDRYGVTGEYSNCSHYYPDEMVKYQACIEHPVEVLQGEISAKNLACGTLRRLMYNPHFDALKISLKQFIDGL